MASTFESQISGIESGVAVKAPALVASTANLTLSGEQTIDGVAVVSGDRVLVKDQTDPIENGIWTASAGAWSRAPDFDGVRDAVQGTRVTVVSGTVGADTEWRLTTASPVIGVSSLAFAQHTLTLGVSAVQSIELAGAAPGMTLKNTGVATTHNKAILRYTSGKISLVLQDDAGSDVATLLTADAGAGGLSNVLLNGQQAVTPPVNPTKRVYLTTGTAATYNVPAGVKSLTVTLIGGGGGGGGIDGQGSGTAAVSCAGEGGGMVELSIPAAELEASYTYTVGAGGSGGTAGANNGSPGGNTTFAGASNTASAGGGRGGGGHLGTSGNSNQNPSGTIATSSFSGFSTGIAANPCPPSAGRTVGGNPSQVSLSGSSARLGGSINAISGATGANAVTPGAGGGGVFDNNAATNYAGGNGVSGAIIIDEHY